MTPLDPMEEQIDVFVRAGYMTEEEVIEEVSELFEDANESELAARVRAKMAERRRELDAISPPGRPSAYERLRSAFEQLEQHGVLAREHYWCCQTCARTAIHDEVAQAHDEGHAPRGYVFFHSQDTDRAAETGLLLIRFSGILEDLRRDGWDASMRIGEELVMVLRAYDFAPEWSGRPDDTINLPITWDKRPPNVTYN